ncbi:MAG: UDP binding domain-containing protein [Hyphomicrobiaceae bacterium]
MGLTFKENCPAVRSTKAIDLKTELKACTGSVTVFDPVAAPQNVLGYYGPTIVRDVPSHEEIDAKYRRQAGRYLVDCGLRIAASSDAHALLKSGGIIDDIKYAIPDGF